MLRNTITRNRGLFLSTLCGVAVGAVKRRTEFRHHVIRDAWTVAKRFSTDAVQNIRQSEIPCTRDVILEGFLEDPHRLLLAALARGLDARTFFEIGTNRGRTTWTVARNNPLLTAYTLDVPLSEQSADAALSMDTDDHRFFRSTRTSGDGYRGTAEEARITQLWGDSARFDFSPYAGSIDLVYVDGAHTYEYVLSDTVNALHVLSPTGTIVWDDYTSSPGVFKHVTELARTLDRPVYHVLGTRMAIYSRQNFVERTPPDHESAGATV